MRRYDVVLLANSLKFTIGLLSVDSSKTVHCISMKYDAVDVLSRNKLK